MGAATILEIEQFNIAPVRLPERSAHAQVARPTKKAWQDALHVFVPARMAISACWRCAISRTAPIRWDSNKPLDNLAEIGKLPDE